MLTNAEGVNKMKPDADTGYTVKGVWNIDQVKYLWRLYFINILYMTLFNWLLSTKI